MAGHGWTFITNELVLCNEIVGFGCFREDEQAEDANDFEKSDIKIWLRNWVKKNGIMFTKKENKNESAAS